MYDGRFMINLVILFSLLKARVRDTLWPPTYPTLAVLYDQHPQLVAE